MKRRTISFGRKEGQVVILMVMAMGIFMMGALGLAIDGGQMYAQRQMAQAAADAAAGAGIMSIMKGTNATSTYTFGTGSAPIASYVCTTTDGRTPCVYARDNGFGGTSADTVTLSYPSTVSGVTLSSVTVPAFTVTVQRTLNNRLIRFVGGPATSTITAKATSGITGTSSGNCIIALDGSASKALSAGGGAILTAPGCTISVNSTNSDALDVGGGASITAGKIDVTGGSQIGGGGSATPTPVTKAAIADPLASLPAYAYGSCTFTSQYSPPNGAVLTQGVYCGGIAISTSVTLSTGVYVIDGGGITFSGGSTVTGTGVMFYLTGTNSSYKSATVSGSAIVTLSALTSGTYSGILFFQDRTITSNQNATFGGGTMALTGTLYFPTTNLNYQGTGSATSYSMTFIADTITLSNIIHMSSGGSPSVSLMQ